ncbi:MULTISPECIES: BatD family protein [unclassified Agarivorans]|uniref:BatD family protein n=1 Tax=unclassified Agarivorans TaxID=2636026 RepID=UPI0026E27D8C|nr:MULTISPECIES: BatD family protein [unclassified Agarivorans]MDO6684738.1 BatD family protein [Agarivorans sp. 3_MG-2023]MDO6715101.1 BatD family protein [Agarivorans sp. 2_MG-2023]
MKALSLLFILLLSLNSYATTEVTATVSQNPVAVNQAFTLEIVANDTLPASEFDSSVLLRQKFVVGGTSTSRQHSSINGVSSTQTRWTTTLLVRDEGTYLIPSFNIGGQQTIPIQLQAKVIEAIEPSKDQVRMEVSLDNAEVYIGQPVRFTAKIWVANSLDQANIIAPSMLGAKIEKLGDDKQDLEVIDGKRYRTLIRQWLITPEKAGQFEVRGPRLSGLANDINRRARPVDIAAQTLSLEVKAPPADFPGTWLPSTDLLLYEEVQPLQSDYEQGQAFTRIINLTVAGITEDQLPDITLDYGDDFRVYPEAYQDRTIVKDGIVFAQRSLNVALIPVNPGEITLPGWSLAWWDLGKDEQALAKVAERTITVVPAPVNQQLVPIQTNLAAQANTVTEPVTSLWTWFFAIAWLITLALLIAIFTRMQKQKTAVDSPVNTDFPTVVDDNWQQFADACKQQQSQQAEQALQKWLAQQAPSKEFAALLRILSKSNWGGEQEQRLNLVDFYQRCAALKSTLAKIKEQEQPALSSLNP